MLKKQRKHRIYSEDFKREAVAMYEASDKTLPEICRLLDISCESVLNRWRVLYGKPKSKRGCMSQTPKKPDNINEMSDLKDVSQVSKSDDAVRILALEDEVRQLRRVLSTHAVREYLAELREESWREVTDVETAKEVERRVAKKR
jgi:transposase-like protein